MSSAAVNVEGGFLFLIELVCEGTGTWDETIYTDNLSMNIIWTSEIMTWSLFVIV